MNKLTYEDIKAEFNLCSSGDSWGECMSAWFDVAAEIYFNRDFEVPADWRYGPGAASGIDEDSYFANEVLAHASDDALQRFGAVINRYAGMLKAAGKDY